MFNSAVMLGVGASLALASSVPAETTEPACVVTYAVDSAREITVTGARCATHALESAALAFAFARLEGPFREMLAAQAPIEVSFTFSETLIRAYAAGSGDI
jgi:hypothetical protein